MYVVLFQLLVVLVVFLPLCTSGYDVNSSFCSLELDHKDSNKPDCCLRVHRDHSRSQTLFVWQFRSGCVWIEHPVNFQYFFAVLMYFIYPDVHSFFNSKSRQLYCCGLCSWHYWWLLDMWVNIVHGRDAMT